MTSWVVSTSASATLKRNVLTVSDKFRDNQSLINSLISISPWVFVPTLSPTWSGITLGSLSDCILSLKTLFGTCTFSVSFTLMICFLSHPQYTIMLVIKIYMLGCTSLFRNFSLIRLTKDLTLLLFQLTNCFLNWLQLKPMSNEKETESIYSSSCIPGKSEMQNGCISLQVIQNCGLVQYHVPKAFNACRGRAGCGCWVRACYNRS